MQQNILRDSNTSKIFIQFKDGKNNLIKEKVSLRFIDNKNCYFSGSIPNYSFSKPKYRTKASITAYTPDGIYKTTVIIRSIEFSLNNVLYVLDVPKKWDFKQLRASSRKIFKLPLTMKFRDELEINTEIFDLSVKGFSFIGDYKFSTIHTRFSSICKIKFPKSENLMFPNEILEKEVLFVRKKMITEDYEYIDKNLYCFKFLNLTNTEKIFLRNFLLNIN